MKLLTFMLAVIALAGCEDRFGPAAAAGGDAERIRKLESELIELRRTVAGADAYICTVKSEHDVADDGTLVSREPSPNIGKVFTLDRKTGIYQGGIGTNSDEERQVVFHPPDNSFHVASTWSGPASSGIDYLAVQDFRPGSLKPFIVAKYDHVLTGTCER